MLIIFFATLLKVLYNFLRRGEKMRLLLAEDEKELSNAITVILKHKNFSVDQVYDGESALDYLTFQEYDGAILDIMMPGMDGITVLKKIRAEGISTPVIMLTAKSELDDKVTGLDAGADDYLTKPFEMKELLARIRSITRRSGDVALSSLTYKDLVLDRKNFSLSSHGKTIPLSGKEFQMMEMLLRSPGTVISPELFLEKIWGLDTENDINIIWVNISYLRKKLKTIESAVSIKATRNVGYSVV